MDFIPLCFTFGCPTKIKPDGDGRARICPRCHNAQVVSGKSRTWFEFCFVPLIPMKSKKIWICGICQWQSGRDGGFEPPLAGAPGYHPPQPQYGYGGPPPPPPQGYPPQGYGGYPPK